MQKRLWITWEWQRRSLELSKKLGCKLVLIDKEGIFRYPFSFFKTVLTLILERPELLFVQNPSMFLATIACLYGFVSKTKIIVDRHTTFRLNKPHSGSFPIWLFMRLHYFTLKWADLTIVTNDFLADLVRTAKGTPFVLPDMLPELVFRKPIKLKGKKNFMLISSLGLDEPIDEILKAMRMIDETDVCLYITGNYKKRDPDLPYKAPENIVFTGFVSDELFFDMLFSVDAAMALTTSDYCMLCGCYEVISAEKPLITSNKKVLKDYFTKALFVDNTAKDICNQIVEILKNLDVAKRNSVIMKNEISLKWDKMYNELEKILSKF